MKLINSKSLTTLVLAGALSVGTASAMGLQQGTQALTSVVGVSSASIGVNVSDGTATLFGSAESGSEAALAEAHVAKLDGVEKVINLITFN
jgi:osmotically-inducible protein OsmY